MRLRYITILTSLIAMQLSSLAQDLHFSQFMQTPLLINSANTGFIPEGDYRLGVNYRNQWASISAFPYKTISVFGDCQLLQNSNETGWLGLGGLLLRDVAGTSALTSTKLYGSVAYHQMINSGSLLSLGFNAGWANKRINTVNLTFPSQWNGQFFDVHQTSSAPLLDANQINYFDLQVGMNYAYFPNPQTYFNVGLSAMHVNRPVESFWSTSTGVNNRISVRYNAFVNASFKLSDRLIIQPNLYFSTQAKAWEAVGGMALLYNISGDGDYTLSAGTYYRWSESLIPQVGVGIGQLQFNFSYDISASTIKNFTSRQGAFEFSIIKQGVINPYQGNRNQSLCPTFR